MTEQLTIYQFGPIQEADIQVRDLTILVGPQAVGKSMTAQLLYFMCGLEGLVARSANIFLDQKRRMGGNTSDQWLLSDIIPSQAILSALERWLGNEISTYAKDNTLVRWNLSDIEADCEIVWQKGQPILSKALETRIQRGLASDPGVFARSQTYIPAGRALYSFLPPASAMSFLSYSRPGTQWPGYIASFYEELGAAINRLWRQQEQEGITLKFFGLPDETSAEETMQFARSRMDAVIKGKIRYGPGIIELKVGSQTLHSETIAAGQMEVWPFWAILENILESAYPGLNRIYFEEPEAHLHPGAQRSVMEIIAHLVSHGFQFVITTHSPYILYAINNSLLAQQVLDRGRELPSDVSPKIALRADQVAAYRFSSDGIVYDIMDDEVGLIDEDELDQVADDLGMTFSRLQEHWEGIE